MSVNHPVDLENRYRDTWPPFLLDLMPQGHARRKLAEHLRLDVDARASDVALLLRAGGNPVGNMRVTEAVTDELYRLARVDREGVTEDEIFQRTEHFIEVLDRFSMIASGSSGLQGEWPKVALTLATDGLYYPDMLVSDGEAVEHYIVKLLRSSEKRDRLILEAEAGYSVLAKTLGLNVHDTSRYENGVLMIRRFDREVAGGELARIGQESMVSALGVAAFGHLASHEDYIGVLKRHSDNAFADIVEYVKRDIANRALGNPDNHGRNSALSKRGDESVRLSPLFDFAPMKLAVEGVARSTRWAAMRDLHRDTTPDWDAVCRAIFEDEAAASALREEISAFAVRLLDAPSIAAAVGIPEEATELAMRDCISVAENALGK
ncbi:MULTISPECIES: type II toxin-antitoxin system HipA family toxin [Rhizobium]|uniref:Serine/threonine-protein kinase HipA n=1 Tax=Rhizobium paranaense TaxID=1650438 RepID=A0A7W9D4Q7_9HYPH|nr:HipA domain-containing protein [Rhizobium paranaense]MBB5577191.1 serine/threonine-protein kinase HipA [Rhizobium paranaense]